MISREWYHYASELGKENGGRDCEKEKEDKTRMEGEFGLGCSHANF